jgi:tetratricopeptide (TPR) repeat protein
MIFDEWPDLSDLLDKTQELLELGLPDDAEALLDRYRLAYQDYWEFHFVYARVFTDQNLPRKAVPHLLRGLRIDRENCDCLLGLFYSYAMMGKLRRGGRFLLEAERLHPESELVLSALIWYYTETNEAESAVACFERARALNTDNPETYRNAGLAFDRLGRYEEAAACYRAALHINPQFEEARDLYADHLIFTGKVDDAIALYDDALGASPKNIRYISKLIYCLSQKGLFDRAEELARQSVALYPNSPLGYIDLAYVCLNTGRPDEAAETADKAISVSPIDAEGYRVMAIAHSERGNYETADEYFEQAVSFDPENPDTLRDYYQHLRAAGRYEQMIDVVNRVIKLESPYCTEDYWFLADYYREKKQNVEAFRYLRLAYNTMPGEKELLPPMIEILLEQGHTKYSLPMFANYVQKSGWTDSMSNFSMNEQFRDSYTQEGMRFLRFTGQRPTEFRNFIFKHYFYRFGLIYYTLIAAAFLFPASLLFGWLGVGVVAVVYGVSLAGVRVYRALRLKREAAQSGAAGKGLAGA